MKRDVDLDTRELAEFGVDLGKVAAASVPALVAVTKKGAQNVKETMVADATEKLSGGHAKLFPRSISYDMVLGDPTVVAFDIGPDKGRPQGALGNILYFGTSRDAPVLDLGVGLDREEDEFLDAVADVMAGSLSMLGSGGGGLARFTNAPGATSVSFPVRRS